MKLTLEELAPYLPYGLKFKCYTDGYPEEIYTMKTLSQDVIVGTGENRLDVELYHFEDVKPILRPLSDLGPGIFSEKVTSYVELIKSGQTFRYGSLPYVTVLYLLKNHYDFQNLIMKGLAVDINTIENN